MKHCAHCGRQDYEHVLIKQSWVQLPLPFNWSPFRASSGYHYSLAACPEFKPPKERGPIPINHSVVAIFWSPTGGSRVVDIGS